MKKSFNMKNCPYCNNELFYTKLIITTKDVFHYPDENNDECEYLDEHGNARFNQSEHISYGKKVYCLKCDNYLGLKRR